MHEGAALGLVLDRREGVGIGRVLEAEAALGIGERDRAGRIGDRHRHAREATAAAIHDASVHRRSGEGLGVGRRAIGGRVGGGLARRVGRAGVVARIVRALAAADQQRGAEEERGGERHGAGSLHDRGHVREVTWHVTC
jgi:hypothetical protein